MLFQFQLEQCKFYLSVLQGQGDFFIKCGNSRVLSCSSVCLVLVDIYYLIITILARNKNLIGLGYVCCIIKGSDHLQNLI